MIKNKVLFSIYALSMVFFLGQCCLDPKEPIDKCTQCNATQVLIESRCFQKMRGCLEYKTIDKVKLTCTTCQNGYVVKGDKCQRQAVAAVAAGVSPTKLNQPAPISPDNPGNLTKANITMPNQTMTGSTKPAEQAPPKPAKVIPQFPEVKIVTNVSDGNLSTKKVQIPLQLQKTISSQFPYLANLQPVQVGPYELLYSGNSDRSWVMYEQGTILLVQKNKNNENSKLPVTANIRSTVNSNTNPEYTITHLSQNRITQQKYKGIKSQIMDKYGELVSSSLSINYEIKLNNTNSKIILNIDLFTGKIKSISHNQCAKQTYDLINKVYESTLRSKYDLNVLIKYAYAQFLQKVVVVNVPDKVESVQAYKSDTNVSLILFKVVYPSSQSDVGQDMKQYAIIKYNVDSNMTDVDGYFIQGVNVLDYFKADNQTSNSTANTTNNTTSNTNTNTNTNTAGSTNTATNTTSTGTTTTSTPTTTTATPTTSSTTSSTSSTSTSTSSSSSYQNTQNSSSTTTTYSQSSTTTSSSVPPAITIPKINQTAPTQAKANVVQSLNLSQVTGTKPVLGSNGAKTQSEDPPKQNVSVQQSFTSSIKNQQDLLIFLKKKQQFFEKTANGYKILQIFNETIPLKPQVNYKIKILTTNGIYDIIVNQNLRNNQLRQSYSLDSSQSCLDYNNDSMISKFDAYLKKSYPVLQTFNKLTPQFKLEQAGQKYLFVYSNEQMKRIVVEINKNKDSTKYIVSKSEVYNYGYCFDKKQMENINFKLIDVSDQCIANNLPAKLFKSMLNQLLTRYKSYVYNSTVVAAIANASHAKIYISNNFATFQFSRKIQDNNVSAPVKGDFVLLQQKYGWDILPYGFKKQLIITSNHPDFEMCKKIEQSLMKKYRTYFGGGSPEILTQKRFNQQVYEYAFKTVLGFFSLVATPLTSGSVNLSPLKKISDYEQMKMLPLCKSNQYFDANDRKCYLKISGCYRQIGNICIMCDSGLILQGGSKQCRKTCKW